MEIEKVVGWDPFGLVFALSGSTGAGFGVGGPGSGLLVDATSEVAGAC